MNHKSAVLWGVGIWAFVFVVAMLAFPLRETERPLFESIMPVALVAAACFASVKYFGALKKTSAWSGFCLGLIWLVVNLSVDAVMFSWGPMKMSLMDYLKDIGMTYLILLLIPTSFGYVLKNK